MRLKLKKVMKINERTSIFNFLFNINLKLNYVRISLM